MFKLSIKLFVVLVVAVSIIFFCSSTAKSATEKLLTVAPDDMLAFVAAGGADELKPAFEKTFLSRIWNDPGTQTFYQSIKNEILKKIEAETEDPNDIKTFETIRDFVKLVLRRPIIIGAAGKYADEKAPVYGFVVLEAGNRKAQISSQLAKVEALVGDGEIIEVKVGSHKMHRLKENNNLDGYWGWVGNYLVFAINEGEGLAIKYLESAKVRSAPDYLSKVTCSGDGLVVYGNYEKCLGVLEAVAAKEDELKQYNQFKAVTRELGIDKIKMLVARVGFSGSDLVIDKFVRIPSPRTGLPGCFKPARLSMLDMVDRNAVRVVALNCDVAGIYDAIFRAIKAVSQNEAYPEINEAIAEFESEAKFQLRGGLLESLSGPMVCFTLPAGAMMEAPGGGAVVIAKLKDKALFEQSMLAIGRFAAAESEGLLQVSSQVQNGRTLHTWAIMPLAMMQVMPTCAIVDDHAVIATNTALCNSAITQMISKANSIRDTEGYKNATAKMANNPLLFAYTDSKVQFNQMMMGIQQFWPMVTMMASKSDIKLPFMLPSLSHIANDMQPACCYCFSDSEGYYSHYRGPGVEQSLGSVAGVSMAAGILMPALARTRSVAYRMVSGTNLSAIGKACLIYANDHDGKYPDNLQQLVEKADLPPKCLTSKFVPKASPEPAYIYISGQDAKMHPGNIIAYDNPKFCPDGVNVLFNDAHVEWVKREKFLKILEETYKSLGREMPEIKFKNYIETELLPKP